MQLRTRVIVFGVVGLVTGSIAAAVSPEVGIVQGVWGGTLGGVVGGACQHGLLRVLRRNATTGLRRR